MTKTSKENDVILKKVLYIYYPIGFQKDTIKNKVLIDSSSKINAIIPAYALKLGFKVRRTDVRAQKIDGSIFKIFRIILASFQIEDKLEKT